MRIDTCPRCGTRRPDELQWCRKCGLDLHLAEKGQLPPADLPRIKTVQDYWHHSDLPPVPPSPVPSRVRLEVDRRWLARFFGNVMDVTLLASIGAAIGWRTGLALGDLIRADSPNLLGILILQAALAAAGGWLGARIALWLIAHWPTG